MKEDVFCPFVSKLSARMTVAKPLAYVLDDIRFQQHLRAAEGYLDIVLSVAERWPPESGRRDRLVGRALTELEKLPDTPKYKADKAYLKGQALRTMERYQEAIEPLALSAELQPSNIHVQLALGWCYKRVDRLGMAIQALELALEVSPDEGIIHYNLACYWSLANNKGLALQYLRQSLDLDPNYLDMIASESDFDPIRDDPDFRMLTSVIV